MMKSRQSALRRRRSLEQRAAMYFASTAQDFQPRQELAPLIGEDWQDALTVPLSPRASLALCLGED